VHLSFVEQDVGVLCSSHIFWLEWDRSEYSGSF